MPKALVQVIRCLICTGINARNELVNLMHGQSIYKIKCKHAWNEFANLTYGQSMNKIKSWNEFTNLMHEQNI